MRALVEQAAYAQRLIQEHEYPAALVELRALDGRLTQLGLQSVWVKWALCVAHDLSDNSLAALDKINEALSLDPFSEANHVSHETVVKRLRTYLLEATEGDPEVARVYQRLLQEDECDVSSHLAWARFLIHGRRHHEAEEVLQAITTLAPASLDAWNLRARVARDRGDAHTAAGCEAESKLRAAQPVALGIPVSGGRS
jgi:predicted Zn-dependent protease